ncbi:MAG: hypothetical protein ACI4AI_05760 [Paludibacteraceae bacterium]
MSKTTKELIYEAEQILSHVYQEDLFGIGTKEDVVKEQDISLVELFAKDLDAYTLHFSNESVPYQRIQENRWLLDGRRVSIQRIQNIIDILKEL